MKDTVSNTDFDELDPRRARTWFNYLLLRMWRHVDLDELPQSIWRPFPAERGGCAMCPPSRLDPFQKRVANRSILISSAIQGRKWARLFPSRARRVVAGGLEIAFLMGIHMPKVNWSAIGLVLAVVLLVILPTVVYQFTSVKYNDLTNILFNVLLCVVSVWLSMLLQKPAAQREARKYWLPFAESACNDLVTIGAAAERMRRHQRIYCGKIKSLIAPAEQKRLEPVLALVDAQCSGAAEKLSALRDQIRGARRDWEGFIRNHCEGTECALIQQRLDELEFELNLLTDKEVPVPACEQADTVTEASCNESTKELKPQESQRTSK